MYGRVTLPVMIRDADGEFVSVGEGTLEIEVDEIRVDADGQAFAVMVRPFP